MFLFGLFIFFHVTMALRNLKLGDRNQIISDFYLRHLNDDKMFTVRHFVNNHGMAKTTVFRAIQRADRICRVRRDSLDRRPGSGRPRAPTRRQERSVLHAVENKKGPSTKRQAGKFKATQRTIQNVLHREGAEAPKRQKAPEIDDAKMERVKERSATLSRDFFPPGGTMAIVIDDESY